jgi:prolyl-tRNA editing enzyme YbaK/EbsC (Cys-tRNA(Pro) deacylase)
MHPVEQRVVDHLESLGASYETIRIDPDLADTAAFCEHYGYALEESANAILVASKKPEGRLALCLALAVTRLDVNHVVRDLLDVRKLSFASPEATIEATGMEIGGVTPFGIPTGLATYVDARVVGLERCIVGGGSREMKVLIDPEVFRRMDEVTVVDGLAA